MLELFFMTLHALINDYGLNRTTTHGWLEVVGPEGIYGKHVRNILADVNWPSPIQGGHRQSVDFCANAKRSRALMNGLLTPKQHAEEVSRNPSRQHVRKPVCSFLSI